MSNNSIHLSIPQSRTVRGYEIRRLPLGKYLQMIDALSGLPQELMRAAYPGKTEMQALAELKILTANDIPALFLRLMTAMPVRAMQLLSLATGIDEETLKSDERIGLDGAAEMVEAVIEVNGLTNFLQAARAITAQVRAAIQRDGSNG